jgi:hypothetical protein
MRAINTLPPVAHSFYRLLGAKATTINAVEPAPAFPLRTLPGTMPRMALINGGTPHAFSVTIPLIHETRTRAGKRVLHVIN